MIAKNKMKRTQGRTTSMHHEGAGPEEFRPTIGGMDTLGSKPISGGAVSNTGKIHEGSTDKYGEHKALGFGTASKLKNVGFGRSKK